MRPFDPTADNEKFLDEELVPLLDELVSMCRSRNVPVICVMQFNSGGIYSSIAVPSGASSIMGEVAEIISPMLERSDPEPLN